MVGKLFSRLAQHRMPMENRYHVDWMASECGLGPKLFASTDNGILMERLDGDSMDEAMVHGSSEWIERVATRLAAFHTMETPSPPNMLWRTIQIMLDMTEGAAELEEKMSKQRESLEPLDLPIVLGHGDLKPSNIISREPPRFIDLETAGMHYRGFDLAKLFRTDHPSEMTESNLNAFLECYLCALPISIFPRRKELDLLKLEVKLLEPLTVRESDNSHVARCHSCLTHPLLHSGWKQQCSSPVQLTWTQRRPRLGILSLKTD